MNLVSRACERTLALTGVGVLHERIHALIFIALALADLEVVLVLVAAVVLRALVLVVVKLGALTHGPVRGAFRAIPTLAQLGARLRSVSGALVVQSKALLLHLVEMVKASVHAFFGVPHHLLDVVLELWAVGAAGVREATSHAVLPRLLDNFIRGGSGALDGRSNDGHKDLLPNRLDLLLDPGLDLFGAAGCLVAELGHGVLDLKSLDGLSVHHLVPRLVGSFNQSLELGAGLSHLRKVLGHLSGEAADHGVDHSV